jgi:hypothetical protein
MSLRSNTFTVLVAVLVFTATIAPFAGVASAVTVHESVVGGDSPRYVHVDVSDMSGGDYTVKVLAPHSEISASQKSSGWRLIYEENGVSTSSDKDGLLFENWGAYTEVKVRIEAKSSVSGSPTFGTGRAIFNTYKSIGYTGGDSDLKCSFTNNLHNNIVGSVTNVDCNTPGERSINISKTDENETHIDVHASALTVGAQSESFADSRSNYLKDVRNVARIEGKNAYIRALENGTTEAVARQKARNAVYDYYTRHQRAILKNRDIALEAYKYYYNRLSNESSDKYYPANGSYNSSKFTGSGGWKSSLNSVDGSNGAVKTTTLLNGSQYNYTTYYLKWSGGSTNRNVAPQDDHLHVFTGNGDQYDINGSDLNKMTLSIDPPDDTYNRAIVINVKRYISLYNKVQNDSKLVADEVDTFANETYEDWQDGKIETSELIDPYLAAREYGTSNQSFQEWNLAALSSLGVSSPETLDNTGKMKITSDNKTYTGILLSDGLPDSGSFTVGETYNPNNLTGSQFVVTDNQTIQLEENFTIDSATTKSGESITDIKYRNISYKTSTLDDYKNLLGNLSDLAAQIEARENVAIGGGSGSGSDGGSDPFGFLTGKTAGLPNWSIVAAAGGALIIASRQ